jgi:hypothetical protein
MDNTIILKEEYAPAHRDVTRFKHTQTPQFPLELCINSQNDTDSFFCKKYTLNGNYLETVIMITVKDFRYATEKLLNQVPFKHNNAFQWKPRGGRH